jgi:hypothetical protein
MDGYNNSVPTVGGFPCGEINLFFILEAFMG